MTYTWRTPFARIQCAHSTVRRWLNYNLGFFLVLWIGILDLLIPIHSKLDTDSFITILGNYVRSTLHKLYGFGHCYNFTCHVARFTMDWLNDWPAQGLGLFPTEISRTNWVIKLRDETTI
ncbi:hypothetical protein TNCV_3656931 [Trichonephila clavipes]|nr:hypothetical protein TNCV_3656931 [Trichonephila clavipes]